MRSHIIPADGTRVNGFAATPPHRINGSEQAAPGEAVTLRSLLELLERTPGLAMITDLAGRLLYMNSTGRRTLGLGQDADISGHTILDDYTEQSRELIGTQAIPVALRDGAWRGETTLIDHRQNEFPVSQVIVFHRTPSNCVLLSIAWDMREQKMRERDLWHRATHDSLTGLPNQSLLTDRLSQEIRSGSRNGALTAVLFLDVDRFKSLNDELGHEAANQLLVELADRLRRCVRAADTVGRYGGDEFVMVLGGLKDWSVISRVLRRVRGAMEEPFAFEGMQLFLTVSIGVAVGPNDGQSARDLLKHADIQMYRSKQQCEAGRRDQPLHPAAAGGQS